MNLMGIRRAFTGIGAALVVLFAPSTAADAAPAPTHRPSICDTGFRGQPAYDRACLTVGDYTDAKREWRTGYTPAQRKAQCRTALRTSMPSLVTETRGDVIFDRYRNRRAMITLTAWAGAAECYRIG
jgi:hypothetical protein